MARSDGRLGRWGAFQPWTSWRSNGGVLFGNSWFVFSFPCKVQGYAKFLALAVSILAILGSSFLSLARYFAKSRAILRMSNARARHETINRRLKTWGILKQVFRSKLAKHHIAFRSVLVLEEIAIENGHPPFQVAHMGDSLAIQSYFQYKVLVNEDYSNLTERVVTSHFCLCQVESVHPPVSDVAATNLQVLSSGSDTTLQVPSRQFLL